MKSTFECWVCGAIPCTLKKLNRLSSVGLFGFWVGLFEMAAGCGRFGSFGVQFDDSELGSIGDCSGCCWLFGVVGVLLLGGLGIE